MAVSGSWLPNFGCHPRAVLDIMGFRGVCAPLFMLYVADGQDFVCARGGRGRTRLGAPDTGLANHGCLDSVMIPRFSVRG